MTEWGLWSLNFQALFGGNHGELLLHGLRQIEAMWVVNRDRMGWITYTLPTAGAWYFDIEGCDAWNFPSLHPKFRVCPWNPQWQTVDFNSRQMHKDIGLCSLLKNMRSGLRIFCCWMKRPPFLGGAVGGSWNSTHQLSGLVWMPVEIWEGSWNFLLSTWMSRNALAFSLRIDQLSIGDIAWLDFVFQQFS